MSTAMRADNCPAARRAGARRVFCSIATRANTIGWSSITICPAAPAASRRLRCPRENTVLVTHEPPAIKSYGRDFCAQFGRVLSCHDSRSLSHPRLNPDSSRLALVLRHRFSRFARGRAGLRPAQKRAAAAQDALAFDLLLRQKKCATRLAIAAATNSRADSRALCRRWIGSGAALTPSGKNPTPSILTAIIWR